MLLLACLISAFASPRARDITFSLTPRFSAAVPAKSWNLGATFPAAAWATPSIFVRFVKIGSEIPFLTLRSIPAGQIGTAIFAGVYWSSDWPWQSARLLLGCPHSGYFGPTICSRFACPGIIS
jgi:hypothetical protein